MKLSLKKQLFSSFFITDSQNTIKKESTSLVFSKKKLVTFCDSCFLNSQKKRRHLPNENRLEYSLSLSGEFKSRSSASSELFPSLKSELRNK